MICASVSAAPPLRVRVGADTRALPDAARLARARQRPQQGPAITIFSGGTASHELAQALTAYTHRSAHVLPVFDDGGSSRELRARLGMPPPGDLRHRLMALADPAWPGNEAAVRLFQARLPQDATADALERRLEHLVRGDDPLVQELTPPLRTFVLAQLGSFAARRPPGFDLAGGSVGNFVIAGGYLAGRALEAVLDELATLMVARGSVLPVCRAADVYLKAALADGGAWIGQARLSCCEHAAIEGLTLVSRGAEGWREARPALNPRVEEALSQAALLVFAMGSFFSSVLCNLLVGRLGQLVRESRAPRLLIANLRRDRETPELTVAEALRQLQRHLSATDTGPAAVADYLDYVLVGTHGTSTEGGRVPIELDAIQALGVTPIVLPLERTDRPGTHDAELVARVLVSLG